MIIKDHKVHLFTCANRTAWEGKQLDSKLLLSAEALCKQTNFLALRISDPRSPISKEKDDNTLATTTTTRRTALAYFNANIRNVSLTMRKRSRNSSRPCCRPICSSSPRSIQWGPSPLKLSFLHGAPEPQMGCLAEGPREIKCTFRKLNESKLTICQFIQFLVCRQFHLLSYSVVCIMFWNFSQVCSTE